MNILNRTHKPLSVSLPGGKVLHLGPGKTGRIGSRDVDHPALKKLVEVGSIEFLGESTDSLAGPPGAAGASKVGHVSIGGRRRSGDR